MRFHPLTKATVLALSATTLAACGGDSNDSSNNDGDGSTTAKAEVRVVHASSDAPNVNAGLNGGGQVSDLAFANATGFLSVPEGDYDVNVDGILPDGGTTTVIDASDVSLSADNETSIFAIGDVGDKSIQPLVTTAPNKDPASDKVRAQVVHASDAAAGAGKLDVYVTAPGADLNSADPLGTFEFKGDIGPATVDSGDYQIRVTPEDKPGTVVFDSGTVSLSGGSDLTIAAIDNTGPANGTRSAPIRLLVAPEGGDSFQILDKGAQAAVRAAHLSVDAGTVDISVDGVNNGDPVVTGLEYDNSGGSTFPANFGDNFTNFLALPEGQQTINVEKNGSVVVSASPDLKAGERYTGYALGQASPDMSFQELSLKASQEDLRPVATEAKVRVVHAASLVPTDQGKVDVYLTAQDAMMSDLDDSNRVLDDVPFKAIADLSVTPGDYELFITAFNDPTVVPIRQELPTLEGGGVYSVVALDKPDESGVASNPGLIVDNDPQN